MKDEFDNLFDTLGNICNPQKKLFVSQDEAVILFNISRQSLHTYRKSGLIKGYRKRGNTKLYYNRAELENFFDTYEI